MGLQEVVTEVRTAGEGRAKEILAAATAEADALVAKARAQVAEDEARRLAQADRDAEQIQRQALSNAQFEARKQVLQAENELRAELRTKIVAGLATLGAGPRKKHLESLLKRANSLVPEGRIWGASQDATVLKASGYDFAGEIDLAGGLIVESPDGDVRLDLSYETLLDDAWRDVLKQESGLFA